MSNSLFSKYIPLNTVIHKLDPRAKLFFSILYLINVFTSKSIFDFSLLITILIVILYFSKISIYYLLTGFKLILFLILFTAILHIIFNNNGELIFNIGIFSLYSGALTSIILLTFRFFLVVSIMIVLTITTSPSEITAAIEKSFKFLDVFRIPVSTFALLISLSIRFIPTIGEETTRIIKSQVSRGANLNSGGIITKSKNFIPILIPIFVSTLKRADELAVAMEVRGYNPDKKRSKYKILKYKANDYIVYILILLLTVLIYII